MKRKLSIKLYALAFIISIIIFGIGIYVGEIFSKANLEKMEVSVEKTSQRLYSLELLLLSDEPELFCPVYIENLGVIDNELESIANKLTYLEEVKGFTDVDLKKQYFIIEVNSYLLAKKINEKCKQNATLILYFYSNERCEKCVEQGAELTEARHAVNNTRLYSFDGDLGSGVADALKAKYNITDYPTIVINDKVFRGYMDREQLKAKLLR